MRANASYSNEGLIAATISPHAADRGRKSALDLSMPQVGFKPGFSVHQLCLNIVDDLNHSATMAGPHS